MDRKEIAAVLARAGMRPQHRFGQNFMVDQNILRTITDAGDIHPGDIILEVGPGVGNLTRLLSERTGPTGAVLAVDIDRKLLPAAQAHHAALTNVEWLLADVLAGKHEVNPAVLDRLAALHATHPNSELKLVSNLPYNAASPLVAELLVEMWRTQSPPSPPPSSPSPPCTTSQPPPPIENRKSKIENQFSRFAFTVQWEVAARMRASIDTSDYGPLGILIQLMADVEVVRKIPPGAFWPAPKVDSALVIVRPNVERMHRIPDAPALQRLLAGIFSHRRQKLSNCLRHFLAEAFTSHLSERITAAGIDLTVRPEVVPPPAFLRLAEIIYPC